MPQETLERLEKARTAIHQYQDGMEYFDEAYARVSALFFVLGPTIPVYGTVPAYDTINHVEVEL